MLGVKLKELRELNGFVQRQIAALLEIDTAYISKMESGDKQISRDHLKKLATVYKVSEKELITLWVADKIIKIIEKEKVGKEAIQVVLNNIKTGHE
jgi:HTH-type transcriptional regulator, competence development regulator